MPIYSGLTLNQDKATKPQTVQIVRQGEATPYWFKVNPVYKPKKAQVIQSRSRLQEIVFPEFIPDISSSVSSVA